MSELKNKKNSRAGHKSYLSYTFSKVDKCLKDYTEDIKNEIEQWKEAFQELEKVTTLSDQILTLIEVDDDLTEEYMSTEVHDTNKLRFEVKLQLSTIGKLLATNLPNEPLPSSPSLSAELQSIKSQGHPPQLLPFRQDCQNLKFRSLGATLVSGRSFGTPLRAQLTKIWLWPTSTNFCSCAAFWLCQHSRR